ncbi:MAG: hypothetical protein ACI4I3_01875 [Acutalibacteraceae bacterium]
MFNNIEKEFLFSLGLNFDFDDLSDEELVQIEESVAEKLQVSGFNSNENINDIGIMCESVLDKLL